MNELEDDLADLVREGVETAPLGPPGPHLGADLTAVRAAGSRRRTRRRVLATALTAAMAVAVAVPVSGTWARMTASSPSPAAVAPGPVAGDPAPEDVLAVLAEPWSALDQLPPTGVDPPVAYDDVASLRLLAATTGARYWAASNAAGEVCFVTLLTGRSPTWGSSCQPTRAFQEVAQHVTVRSSGSLDAWLVPDGWDTTALAADGYTDLGRGVWAALGDGETVVDLGPPPGGQSCSHLSATVTVDAPGFPTADEAATDALRAPAGAPGLAAWTVLTQTPDRVDYVDGASSMTATRGSGGWLVLESTSCS